MRFNFLKSFTPSSQKELPVAPITGVDIETFGQAFSRGSSSWNRNGEMQQYGKSLYVFAAVNKIAGKVAAIEFSLFKSINIDGDSQEIFYHPALDLMARPNPYQTRTEFIKTAWINKKLTGEAYWLKIRNKQGKVVELWNLRPDLMVIIADPSSYVKEYILTKFDGTREHFQPDDIIYFKDPDPLNAFRGMSPISVSKTRIETERSATEYQRDFFRNNSRPDALLITDETLDWEQKSQMTSAWDEEHQGKRKNSKLGILEGGMKYQQVSLSQREMDYIESSKFTRDDILVALGIPKSIITTEGVTFNNADSGIRMFLSETIIPEMSHLVEVLNEMLITPEYGEEFYFDFTDPSPEDRDSQRKDDMAGWGHWLTTNEIREGYNLPTIAGGDTIAPLVAGGAPVSVTDKPVVADPNAPVPSSDGSTNPPNPIRAFRAQQRLKTMGVRHLHGHPMLRKRFEIMDAAVAMLKKQKISIIKSIKDQPTYRSLFPENETRQMFFELTNKRIDRRSEDFNRALLVEASSQRLRVLAKLPNLAKMDRMMDTKAVVGKILDIAAEGKIFANIALPFLVDFSTSGGKDAALLTEETFVFTDALRSILETRAKFFGGSITDTTFQKLTSTLSEGIDAGEGIKKLTTRVNDVYDEYPDWRAGMIARTETTFANNQGALSQYMASDVVEGKEWIATLDGRTRDSHASINGQIVAKGEKFSNDLIFPGDSGGAPEETINCRCVLGPALYVNKGGAIPKKKVAAVRKIVKKNRI